MTQIQRESGAKLNKRPQFIPMTDYRAQLLNAPARLSDLRGDALARALAERHRDNRDAWLASRERPLTWRRLFSPALRQEARR